MSNKFTPKKLPPDAVERGAKIFDALYEHGLNVEEMSDTAQHLGRLILTHAEAQQLVHDQHLPNPN